MARVNVYLPDDLAAQAKAAGLNLSSMTQEAVRQALAQHSTDAWLDELTHPGRQVHHDVAMAALDTSRDELTTRHG